MTKREDFLRAYRQHLSEPDVRIKRHLKLARQFQLHPLKLVDPDPALMAAIELIVDAEERAVATCERALEYTPEQLGFLHLMEDVVTEECPADAPWLSADPDFIRQTIGQQFAPGEVEPAAIATAVAWIVDRAAR